MTNESSSKTQAYSLLEPEITVLPPATAPGATHQDTTQQQSTQQQQSVQYVIATPATAISKLPPTSSREAEGPTVMTPTLVPIESRKPVMLTYCPHCAAKQVETNPRTETTGATWVACVVGVVICWPLCWIPFCVKGMKQTNHHCCKCGVRVGRVKAFH